MLVTQNIKILPSGNREIRSITCFIFERVNILVDNMKCTLFYVCSHLTDEFELILVSHVTFTMNSKLVVIDMIIIKNY